MENSERRTPVQKSTVYHPADPTVQAAQTPGPKLAALKHFFQRETVTSGADLKRLTPSSGRRSEFSGIFFIQSLFIEKSKNI